MRKGFAINTELLKNGGKFTNQYFDELLETIREIRASERKVYEKVTDLFATSYDYNKKAAITREFYSKVQNKLYFAVSGLTAPEIIKKRASSKKEHMGLTSWSNAPDGKILLSDTKVAKNYLTDDEIRSLNRIVNMYLDYAEDRAERQIPMSMRDWAEKLDKFLEFNECQVFNGSIDRNAADKFVEKEYETFRIIQDKEFKSDYNEFIDLEKMIIS